MKSFALVIPLGLVGVLFFFGTMPRASPEARFAGERPLPAPIVSQYAAAPTVTAAVSSLPREVASLPRTVSSLPWTAASLSVTSTPEPRRIPASLPTVAPTKAPEPTPIPTETPKRVERKGCDPAYPDEDTCIPPGPPFGQGCAVTEERLFTVLPPDPQRLDHDKDGVGCEPI